MEKKHTYSFVGGELDFLKLDSVLVGFSEDVLNSTYPNCCSGAKCEFWLVELKWSQDKFTDKVFTCSVCVLMMWSDCGCVDDVVRLCVC